MSCRRDAMHALLQHNELLQMAGRAGRHRYDTIGAEEPHAELAILTGREGHGTSRGDAVNDPRACCMKASLRPACGCVVRCPRATCNRCLFVRADSMHCRPCLVSLHRAARDPAEPLGGGRRGGWRA